MLRVCLLLVLALVSTNASRLGAQFECTHLVVDQLAQLDDRFSPNACIIISEITPVDCSKVRDLFVDSADRNARPCPGYDGRVSVATNVSGTQIVYTQLEDAVLNCPFDPVLIQFYGTLYMTNATDFLYEKPHDLTIQGIPYSVTTPATNITVLVPVNVTVWNATLGANVTETVFVEEVTGIIPAQTITVLSTIVGFQNLQVKYNNVTVTLDDWVADGCGTDNGLFLTKACPAACGADDTNYCKGAWFPKSLDVVNNSICMQTAGVFNGSTSLYLAPSATSVRTDPASKQFQFEELTLEAWVYPTATYATKNTVIAGNHGYDVSSTGSVGYALRYTQTTSRESSSKCTSIGFVITVNGATSNDLICKTPAVPYQWQHLAGTYSQTDGMLFYVDGVLACNKSASKVRAPDYDTTLPFRVGAGYAGSSLAYYTGQVDDVRLWNYARTASQIATYYSVPISAPTLGLVVYFPFDYTSAAPFINESPYTTLSTWTDTKGKTSTLNLTAVYDCMCVTPEASCVPSRLYFEAPPTAVASILSTDSLANYEFIRGELINPNGNYGILWLPGTTVTTGPSYNRTTVFVPGVFQQLEAPESCSSTSTSTDLHNVTTTTNTTITYNQTFVPGANPHNLPIIGSNPWADPIYDFFMPGWFLASPSTGNAYLASNFYPGVFVPVDEAPPNIVGQLSGCTGHCKETFVAGIQWPNGTFTAFPLASQYYYVPNALGGFCWSNAWPDECVVPVLPVTAIATVPQLVDRYNCSVGVHDVEPTFLDPSQRDPCFVLRQMSNALGGGAAVVNGTGCDFTGAYTAPTYLHPLDDDPCSIVRALVSLTGNDTAALTCSDGSVPKPAIYMPCLKSQNLTMTGMVVQNYYGEKVACVHSCDERTDVVIASSNFTAISGSAVWLSGIRNLDFNGNVLCPCGGMTEGCFVLEGSQISSGEYWIYNNRQCAVNDLLPYTCAYPLTETLYCSDGVLLCLDVAATLDINCQQVTVADGVSYFDTACAVYSPCQCGSEDQVIVLPDGTNVTVTANTGNLIIDISFLTPLIASITGGAAQMNISCSVASVAQDFNYSCLKWQLVNTTVGNVTTTSNVSYYDTCTISMNVNVGSANALACSCPTGYNSSFATNLTGSAAANALGIYSTCAWAVPNGLPGEECLNGVVQCPYSGGTLGSGAPPPVPVGECTPAGAVTLDCLNCLGGQQPYEDTNVTCPATCTATDNTSSQYFTASCKCVNYSLVETCTRDTTCVPAVPCANFTNVTLCAYTGSYTLTLADVGTIVYPCFLAENATGCTGYNYAGSGTTPPDGYMRFPCANSYVTPGPGPCSCSSVITTPANVTVACSNTTANATCNVATPTLLPTGYTALQLTCGTNGELTCRCDGAQAITALSYNGSMQLNTSAAFVVKRISLNATFYQQNNVAQQLPYGWRYIQFAYDLIAQSPLLVLGWFSDKAVMYESARLSPLITGTVADWALGVDTQWNFRTCNFLDPGPDQGVYDNECKQYRPSENTSCVVDSTYEIAITNDYGVTKFARINDAISSGCDVIIVHKSLNVYHERMRLTKGNTWIGSYDGAIIVAAGHGVYSDAITLRGLNLQHTNAIDFPLIEATPVAGVNFDTDFTDAPDTAQTPNTFRILNCVLDGANVDKAGAIIGLFGVEFTMLFNTVTRFHTRAVYIACADVDIRMNTWIENHGWQMHLISGYRFAFNENLLINPKGKRRVNNLELVTFKCQGDYGKIVKQDIGTLDFSTYTEADYINLFNIDEAVASISPKNLGCNPTVDPNAQCEVAGNRMVYEDETTEDQRSTVGFRFIGGNITADRFHNNFFTHGQIGADFTYTPSITYLQADVVSMLNGLIRVQDSFSIAGKSGADFCFQPPGSLASVCCYYPNCWPNTSFPIMEVNPRFDPIVALGYGFLYMLNITDAARYGYPMQLLNVTSGTALLRREVLSLVSDVYAVGYRDAYCCACPVIYGSQHQIATSQVILECLEFRFETNISDNSNIAVKLFETPAGFLADDVQFWNVNFDGRQILGDGKIRIANIHIEPTAGIFALRDSRVYNWWSLPLDARRGTLASAKADSAIIAFNEGTEYFLKTKMPSIEGFYVYFQQSDAISTTPYVAGSKSNPSRVYQSSCIVMDNVFRDLDGNVLTVANPANWEITGNRVLDCGVRQPLATAAFFLNGNPRSLGQYFFESNYFNTTKYYLCPWGGGRNNFVPFSAVHMENLLFPSAFVFRNNTIAKNGANTHYPIGQGSGSSGKYYNGSIDWGWFKTAGPRILDAPWQNTQTPAPNTWNADTLLDRDTNRNRIITGSGSSEAARAEGADAVGASNSYGDPVQLLLSINAEGKPYIYDIEDNTTGYPYAVSFNLPPQVLVMTNNPAVNNLSFFGSFADQLYPLRIVAVDNNLNAMALLAYGNITRVAENTPYGLRGITADLVLCSDYKTILQSSFQQCTICNGGCPIPLPTECRVDPANATFVTTNPYFGSWLFSNIADAMLGCRDSRRVIVVVKQPHPYTDPWKLTVGNWTIETLDRAEVLVSTPITVYASNLQIRGFVFIHGAGAHSPTMLSSTLLAGRAPENITLHGCQFQGGNVKQSAILGEWTSLSLKNVRYTGYYSTSASVVDITSKCGMLFMENNTFHDAKYSALTAASYDAYTLHNNKFRHCGRGASNTRPYCVYVSACQNSSTRIVFSRNHQHEPDYHHESGHARVSSYWLNTLPLVDASRHKIPHIDLTFNHAGGLDIGLRVTNVEDVATSSWVNNRETVMYLDTGSKNQDVKGQWHYIVWGEPSDDHLIEVDPTGTWHYWCDNDCSSGKQWTYAVIVIYSVVGFLVLVCCFIWQCTMDSPLEQQFVDGVPISSNVIYASVPHTSSEDDVSYDKDE